MLIGTKTHGFSMIELMIGLVIVGVLIAVGFPAFNAYIQNSRVLATAENFNNMVQGARAEAVRRNARVEFILTSATTGGNTAATGTLATVGGANWLVRTADLANAGQFEVVNSKFAAEGSTTVTTSGGVGSITFTNLGGTNLGAATTFNFGSNALACSPTGPVRCLAVRVGSGGQSRLCDPLVTATTDTRSC